jgi:pSer/pThr/pTyr-binding forkhead associated (FHA) protein
VEPGTQELLGRHPKLSKHAGRLRDDTVSRRHATIGVRPDGEPWIRDEFSANGTYVNNVKLAPGGEQTLRHGDRIRLGEVLQLKVQLVAARRPSDDLSGG